MRKFFLCVLVLTFFYCDSIEFHICTVASKRNTGLEKLELSCLKNMIDLKVLGLEKPYAGNGTKLIQMLEYLETLEDDHVVMFVDAYDVIIIADKEKIVDKFLSLNSPFIMSAERNCYPFPDLCDFYPPSSTQNRFLNTGSYIGYVKNIKSWLKQLQPINRYEGDQGQVTKHYLFVKKLFTLDYTCELFLPLYITDLEELSIDPVNHSVIFLPTNSSPLVIHANGQSFAILNTIYDLFFENDHNVQKENND